MPDSTAMYRPTDSAGATADPRTALRLVASESANRAVESGVPITKLGAKNRPGMSTRNYATIKAFLEIAGSPTKSETERSA